MQLTPGYLGSKQGWLFSSGNGQKHPSDPRRIGTTYGGRTFGSAERGKPDGVFGVETPKQVERERNWTPQQVKDVRTS